MATRRSHVSLSLVVGQDHREASDADVARGLMAREDWALTEAWERFAPMVLMTARRLLGSKSAAEDIAQDVFYRVFLKAHTLREPDRLRSFVYSVAMRALASELRRNKQRAWFDFDGSEVLGDLGCEIESRDLLRKFHALLAQLPARESQVFVLKRMESMTIEEIALILETSVSTVKRRLVRATEQLAHAIKDDPGLTALLARERWGK